MRHKPQTKAKQRKQKAITKTQRREKCFESKDTDFREKTEASLEVWLRTTLKNRCQTEVTEQTKASHKVKLKSVSADLNTVYCVQFYSWMEQKTQGSHLFTRRLCRRLQG